MKVKIKKQGGLAIDCRTNVYFNVDDVLKVGDKNLTEENLTELIDLGYGKKVLAKTETKVEKPKKAKKTKKAKEKIDEPVEEIIETEVETISEEISDADFDDLDLGGDL